GHTRPAIRIRSSCSARCCAEHETRSDVRCTTESPAPPRPPRCGPPLRGREESRWAAKVQRRDLPPLVLRTRGAPLQSRLARDEIFVPIAPDPGRTTTGPGSPPDTPPV